MMRREATCQMDRHRNLQADRLFHAIFIIRLNENEK